MAECTRVPQEEIERRESYLRAYQRPFQWTDPFTYSYPAKTALITAALGTGAVTIHNILFKMPWYYGLYARLATGTLGVVAGYYMGKLREHHYSTRDAVVSHYMEIHPTDFERLNDYYGRPYSNVLLPWIPVRPQYRQYD